MLVYKDATHLFGSSHRSIFNIEMQAMKCRNNPEAQGKMAQNPIQTYFDIFVRKTENIHLKIKDL